jgi:GNAT superfamily N-acetyltransferase
MDKIEIIRKNGSILVNKEAEYFYTLDNLIMVNKFNVRNAVDVLSKAFFNYPDLKYLFPDGWRRKQITHDFFVLDLFRGIKYGEVYATPGMEGAANWIRSEFYPLSLWRVLRSVPLPNIINFTRHGGWKLNTLGEHLDNVHKRLTPFKHMYLETLGVDPHYKGQGYASKLLRPMLSRTDREGIPCYLETGDERNVRLYEHFGFRVVDKSAVPRTELTSWAMLREAQ